MSDRKKNLVNDIENRLDEFFGEGEISPEPALSPAPIKTSLEKLKSVVLSIDWEITDSCLSDLVNETQKLLPVYADDRYVCAMLQMMQSLGRYIRKRKAQAHPDAIRRIMAAFQGLEHLLQNIDLTKQSKINIVAKEIAAFKRLKEQVEFQRVPSMPAQSVKMQNNSTSTSFVEHHHFERAISSVDKRIDTEIKSLKTKLAILEAELKRLR